LNGVGHLVAGFRPFKQFGVGINFTTLDVAFKIDGKASGSGSELFAADGGMTQTVANLGMRLDIVPGRLALGGTIALVRKTTMKINTSSPLMGAGGLPGGAAGSGGSSNNATDPFSSFLIGAMVAPIPKVRLLADLKYERANKNEQMFSLVDLTTKTRDAHDTLSFRGGAIFSINESTNGMLGYHREPAKYGQGGTGDGSLSGFGTIDLIMIMAGAGQELQPYEQYGVGAQFGLLPRVERHGKAATGYYALSLSTGLVYKKASLGIDENGEQPGAYYYKATTIPIGVTYRM
jgi:hypothetical protein